MNPPSPDRARPGEIAGHFFRHEGARLVAVLTGQLGVQRLQLAEDVVQEALVRALQTWPYRGVPENPAAWLTQTAKNLALDHLRRAQRFQEKEAGIAQEHERWLATPAPIAEDPEQIADDCLRMMFVCFHPQLSAESQTALALRTLCGFSAAEIASAFLTSEAAISKRLVRARQRIRELALPFAVPGVAELPARLSGVLGTLYLLFNEGYKASSGEHLVRVELCHEAIRLAELLLGYPATRQPQTYALLAMMLLNAGRLPARTDADGNLLRLREQDRAIWNQALIQRGIHYLSLAATGDTMSEYHLQAAIAACHSTAVDEASTDWARILTLYDRLLEMTDSPVVALNRTVAVARIHGPQAGLAALAAIRNRRHLDAYYLTHVVAGEFEAQLERYDRAASCFRKALEFTELKSERTFLASRLRDCEQHGANER